MTRLVRVANAGVKVAGFSVICRMLLRVAGKGVSWGQAEANESVGRGRNIENDSMDLDYCQGISTIILSFERETRKWSGWKELAGILQFGETVAWRWHSHDCGLIGWNKTRTFDSERYGTRLDLTMARMKAENSRVKERQKRSSSYREFCQCDRLLDKFV